MRIVVMLYDLLLVRSVSVNGLSPRNEPSCTPACFSAFNPMRLYGVRGLYIAQGMLIVTGPE